ncbi:hypothetical protein CAEBREN_29633, partial [Caenorhabditis brenneri]
MISKQNEIFAKGNKFLEKDYRCIWCGCCVHDTCIGNLARSCSLGHSALSVISPLALKEVNQMGQAVLREEAYGPQADAVRRYEELVIERVRTFLDAEQSSDIIQAAQQLCTTIRELVHNVSHTYTLQTTKHNNKLLQTADSEEKSGGEIGSDETEEGRPSSDTMTE